MPSVIQELGGMFPFITFDESLSICMPFEEVWQLLVLWLMAICVRGIENDANLYGASNPGNPPKQPPEIALEFFSVKKKC